MRRQRQLPDNQPASRRDPGAACEAPVDVGRRGRKRPSCVHKQCSSALREGGVSNPGILSLRAQGTSERELRGPAAPSVMSWSRQGGCGPLSDRLWGALLLLCFGSAGVQALRCMEGCRCAVRLGGIRIPRAQSWLRQLAKRNFPTHLWSHASSPPVNRWAAACAKASESSVWGTEHLHMPESATGLCVAGHGMLVGFERPGDSGSVEVWGGLHKIIWSASSEVRSCARLSAHGSWPAQRNDGGAQSRHRKLAPAPD